VWKLIENETFSWQKPFGLIDLEEKEGKNSYYSPSLSAEFIGKLDQ
jgi:dipeptidyl-peptidase-3